MRATATALFGCRTRSTLMNLRWINAVPAAQAVRCRCLTKNPRIGGDIVWHLWYLVGAGGGFAAALFIIGKAAQRLHDENSREARSNMVWSIVGSLLMMPLSGVMLAAISFMVMK